MLLELRSQSVYEQNKLQDVGGEDDANEFDVTAVTEKTLDNDDEAALRGKDILISYGSRIVASIIRNLKV